MRHFSPDSTEFSGDPSSQVPSGMDNDPNADEEVINQQEGEEYPKAVEKTAKIAPDDLADSIAYALDGSGPGPTNAKPNVSGHKVISEGITGASLDDEEEALRS